MQTGWNIIPFFDSLLIFIGGNRSHEATPEALGASIDCIPVETVY